jgi:hypothetical protein
LVGKVLKKSTPSITWLRASILVQYI